MTVNPIITLALAADHRDDMLRHAVELSRVRSLAERSGGSRRASFRGSRHWLARGLL